MRQLREASLRRVSVSLNVTFSATRHPNLAKRGFFSRGCLAKRDFFSRGGRIALNAVSSARKKSSFSERNSFTRASCARKSPLFAPIAYLGISACLRVRSALKSVVYNQSIRVDWHGGARIKPNAPEDSARRARCIQRNEEAFSHEHHLRCVRSRGPGFARQSHRRGRGHAG